MADVAIALNPAQVASERALGEVYTCLDRGTSFRLEAGAGAGKTYTLVKALKYLIAKNKHSMTRRHQHIACITFTNVAKDEIDTRTDRDPLIYTGTIHSFCWSLISGLQKQIRERLPAIDHWPEKIAESGALGDKRVEYSLGHRSIKDTKISLHHDDVLALTVHFMENPKFLGLVKEQYPIILIDEYQDTNGDWMEAIKSRYLGTAGSPLFGFFGDHWQKIYGDGCGRIEHSSLHVIGKEANFRSVRAIVDCLNRMRPELPQHVEDANAPGTVSIFHTNSWHGTRRTGQHWGGDLPEAAADNALTTTMRLLSQRDWNFSPAQTKILMLTHRGIANKQGYASLPSVFQYNDSFTKKEDPHIAFFADVLEPACEAFAAQKYGEMFAALGRGVPPIKGHADKVRWSTAMACLLDLRTTGTVGNVIDYLQAEQRPALPDALERRGQELREFDTAAGEEMPRSLSELQALRAIPYGEISALCKYLAGHSPFETKHGVKGAEFENVLVVVGRGWNQYNFGEMLELASDPVHIPANRAAAYERNRNLFYVACSRPRKRLAVLFTQQLSQRALQTTTSWFGAGTIADLELG